MDIRVTHTLPDGDVRACTVRARAGQTILEALRAAHVAIQSPCGGAGVCGKCQVAVRLPNGAESEVLACQTKVVDAMEVELGRAYGALCVESGVQCVLDAVGRFPLDPASEGELGIGFDLGTTTIAAYLFEPLHGRTDRSGWAGEPSGVVWSRCRKPHSRMPRRRFGCFAAGCSVRIARAGGRAVQQSGN